MNIVETKLLITITLFIVIVCCGCSNHLYTKDELVGSYCGKTATYPHSYLIEDLMYDKNLGQFAYKKDKQSFLYGDTGNTSFTYYIYHRLTMKSLRLHEDGTFILSYSNSTTTSKGLWAITQYNTLVLEFEPIPRDRMYLAGLFMEKGPFPNEGTRELKIINKNKLRFECPKFRAPENYKEVTTYKRVK